MLLRYFIFTIFVIVLGLSQLLDLWGYSFSQISHKHLATAPSQPVMLSPQHIQSVAHTQNLGTNVTTTDPKKILKNNLTKVKPEPIIYDNNKLQASADKENVWEAIRSELKLNRGADSAAVNKQIKYLLAEKGKFNKILKDASPYIAYIYSQTKEKNFPAEIALIPFIESEFNPNDHSNVGALGLWQLMRPTARLLGVKVNSQYDGRRNLLYSTKAALVYLNDMHNYYKDWALTIAAYNCGQGRLDRAIRQAGSRSFWRLNVPAETKSYVPRLLAVAAIISNPQKYNITLPNVTKAPYFSKFTVNKSVTLSEFAKNSKMDLVLLTKLNPDYKNHSVPKNTALLVPLPANKIIA